MSKKGVAFGRVARRTANQPPLSNPMGVFIEFRTHLLIETVRADRIPLVFAQELLLAPHEKCFAKEWPGEPTPTCKTPSLYRDPRSQSCRRAIDPVSPLLCRPDKYAHIGAEEA
jgi:hypothetical protein